MFCLRGCLLALVMLTSAAFAADRDTLIVLVRHAEKADDGTRDPALSKAGQARAQALARALAAYDLKAVYVSQFRRTQLTAQPAAEAAGLQAIVRPASADTMGDADALATVIRSDHQGQSLLVVGHSNTIPALVSALSGAAVEPIADSAYGDLYLVSIGADGSRRLLHTRY
jgi:broad specificity phosphatase PhoE